MMIDDQAPQYNAFIRPPALKKGGRIGVCAPAWHVENAEINYAKAYWADLGYKVYLHPQLQEEDGAIGGLAERRTAALHDLLLDDNIDAVILAGGGYGCIQILDFLDYELIKTHPKIIMGYSDVTILLLAIQARCHLVTFHGPDFRNLPRKFDCDFTRKYMKIVLGGGQPEYNLSDPNYSGVTPTIVNGGTAHGPILGGNHVRMKDLVGTDYLLPMNDAIYFTESNRPMYTDLDANLHHLFYAHMFNRPKAALFGVMDFVNTHNPNHENIGLSYNLSPREMLLKHFPDVPSAYDMPFSHVAKEFIICPLGIEFELELSADKSSVQLRQMESAVVV